MDCRPDPRRRNGRPRRRPALGGLEGLEARDLLAFSPTGFSLPDLVVSGDAAPVAAWGGAFAVRAEVRNLGASTMIEPLALAPGAPSSADAPPSQVGVYISRYAHRADPRAIRVGTIAVPAVQQNSLVVVTGTFNLPDQPPGFPGNGGQFYVTLVADDANVVAERDSANNSFRVREPVLVTPNLPDIRVLGIDLPPVIQPGDTIQPNIRVANFGSADITTQGPLVLRLVASLDQNFDAGDSTIAQYVIEALPPQSVNPTERYIVGDVNVDLPTNITTLFGANVTVPTEPGQYYIGIVVDPGNSIRELSETGRVENAHAQLADARRVGVNDPGLPPAGVLSIPIRTQFPEAPVAIGSVGAATAFPAFPFPSPTASSTGATSALTFGQRTRDAIGTPTRARSINIRPSGSIDRLGSTDSIVVGRTQGITDQFAGFNGPSRRTPTRQLKAALPYRFGQATDRSRDVDA